MRKLSLDISSLEEDAIVHWISCGQGKLPIRQWQNPGAEKIVLLHGGSGSWLHWVKNIRVLQKQFDVYAIDLPGLGDAAMCDVDSDALSAAAQTALAFESLFDEPFHIVAFSWGCTITALIMARLEHRLKSVMLTGPAAVGDLPRGAQMKLLVKRTALMSRKEVLAAHRENLAILMIHNPDVIDDLAVQIQEINTSKARFSSPQYARTTLLIEGVRTTTTPLFVIYGDHDAPAYPELDARRIIFAEARADVKFELVADAGHWLQYEKPETFNEYCIEWLLQHS